MGTWLAAASLVVSGCNAPESVTAQAAVIGRAQLVEPAGSAAQVRYCEYFLVPQGGPQTSGEASNIRVVYYAPEGREGSKVAEKRITGVIDETGVLLSTRPQIAQEDFRLGEVREVSRSETGWRMRYRADRESGFTENTLPMDKLDVIDAGFDPYVRQHWHRLEAGETVQFQFASPVHGRSIKLRARAIPCAREASDLCLRVELAQAFLRWIAGGGIDLEYSAGTDGKPGSARLTRFVGVTNLLDKAGEPQRLQLDYFYR
ncbi:hypothetical protein [Microbulbifer mangrovi]|uniref:hypothetical protein n=1 Tax=Microbulbifer mangrovi TaxID=927787 RepID=UPI00099064F7|nr:hypothetical protein [Microbulbifer mangrovi]